MRKTDYSQISKVYDRNPIRHYQPKEILIDEILRNNRGQVKIADIACGTGNFLKSQQKVFKEKRIIWFGCDLSPEMLEIARRKVPSAELINADAAHLPYKDNFFNFITCNYAFHHFTGKVKSLKEIFRVLKPGGIFLMKNMCLEYMPLSWIYRYFPETLQIDRQRFWSSKKIFSRLERIGFMTQIRINVIMERNDFDKILAEAENRDVSQLTLISDSKYREGIRNIHKDKAVSNSCLSQFAELRCIAIKK